MKWVSELLLPVSRGKQGKIRDRGLARLVQGGYALWNPNDQTVILLPAGKKLYDRAAEYLLKALEGFAPQAIDVCGSSRGSLDAAVRLVRRAGDLPLLLAQRTGDRTSATVVERTSATHIVTANCTYIMPVMPE